MCRPEHFTTPKPPWMGIAALALFALWLFEQGVREGSLFFTLLGLAMVVWVYLLGRKAYKLGALKLQLPGETGGPKPPPDPPAGGGR